LLADDRLQELIDRSGTVPAVNQVECHPYLRQETLISFCKAAGITVMAYSPFGAGAQVNGTGLLEDKTVLAVAAAHKKTAAQVLVRWSVQRGLVCIPKSTSKTRLEQNLDCFSWELTQDGMKQLEEININHRFTRGWTEGQWFYPGELVVARL